MHKTLFAGRDLALDCYDGGHAISIVCFEPRDKNVNAVTPSPFLAGFGAGRFAPLGFNEFIIKKSRNHWYQTHEIIDVAKIINSVARKTKVITYGGSMGGFAAINFAPTLNAHKFIALSPLFDVKMGNDAGDVRWEVDSKFLDFHYNFLAAGACRSAQGYAFYCTGGPDEKHAVLIKSETQANIMPVEYGSHPCSFYLNETYKLKEIVKEIAHDNFDIGRFYSVLAEKTLQTYYPYERRGAELAKSGDVDQAIACIEKAIEFKPGLARLHARLAELLLTKKDLAGAGQGFRAAIDLDPLHPDYLIKLSYVHAARKDYASAAETVRLAIKIRPKKPEYHARLGEWLIAGNDLDAAETAVLEVIKLNPKAIIAPKRLKVIRDMIAARRAA